MMSTLCVTTNDVNIMCNYMLIFPAVARAEETAVSMLYITHGEG